MGRRLQFQALLESLHPGLKVYFQPPATITMVYPCIKYERDRATTEFANDRPYTFNQKYQVTLISRPPDTDIYDKLAALPKTVHDRFFVIDNLNHDVFSIYF
jgi:hypothetical protein